MHFIQKNPLCPQLRMGKITLRLLKTICHRMGEEIERRLQTEYELDGLFLLIPLMGDCVIRKCKDASTFL